MKVASKPIPRYSTNANTADRRFLVMTGASIQFVVLTIIAMIMYPGGLLTDESTIGYNFFRNFFSDLGRTVSYDGGRQWSSAGLFFIALSLSGLGMIYFFTLAPRLFKRQRVAYILSIIGSVFGVISGICFVGIALTPANLLLAPHVLFVQAAFSVFMVVVICYATAIWQTPSYPNLYMIAYLVFGIFLAGYIYLLFWGPSARTDIGLIINATGQKMVAYTALINMAFQSVGAWRVSQEG